MELTGIDVKYQETVCKDEVCENCEERFECQDSVKHTMNTFQDRMSGKISHQELLDMNTKRFGPRQRKFRLHWTKIIDEGQQTLIKGIFSKDRDARSLAIYKMSNEAIEEYRYIMDSLLEQGWYSPYVFGERLYFKSIYEPEDDRWEH